MTHQISPCQKQKGARFSLYINKMEMSGEKIQNSALTLMNIFLQSPRPDPHKDGKEDQRPNELYQAA